ncbi:hypothetical protein JDV02_009776 [Purpureocillium takamizusanense]|uniref:Proline-rich protein RiP-15 n=1 Tax=Purpureocillium takamizusanense TaxID=2060973 RepID=A0A9Q8QQQ1_9HYPO|nr:uncharacterized protein JDV02_009776 [Purpureocillium takamizusanense]UNI23993.1 hypothetical protein JDV02_009776 [Purpureocillium takamizusanense]
MSAPPPPPPHGEAPRSSGLPPGKYDIFVIPEHSAGSGFLYLPSLQPNVNSFAAGFASALILVAVFQSMAPAFKVWWEGFQGLGNMGITLLILGVGFGAWSLGRTQNDTPPGARPGPSAAGGGGSAGFGASASGSHAGPPPPPHGDSSPPPPPQQDKPKPSWQQQRSTPQPGTTKADTPKGSWEKAREETRKKEEERKTREAEQKRREEAAKRLAELRAKEARERQEREKDRERKEKEAQDKKDKDLADKRKKDLEEKLANEKKEKEAKEHKLREEQQRAAAAGTGRGASSSYAYSGVGEKTSMWPNGRPNVAPSQAGSPSKSPPSPGKKPPAPTAKTYVSADEDAHSFRPYDQPKTSRRRPSLSSMGGSESSWAPSHTTARTSPPPSFRGPYTTKDPDKIVINAVYLFMNQFAKTPASQLVSGIGSVTDGLILRITTEGLFIDDDVRGVPQREWDVKAWTLKHVETGGWKAKGLHILRANVRDQEGKRYMFVLDETESWKVAVGLQRLRRGTQVRQLGVSSMSPSEARGTLETLGWAE